MGKETQPPTAAGVVSVGAQRLGKEQLLAYSPSVESSILRSEMGVSLLFLPHLSQMLKKVNIHLRSKNCF